MKLSRFGFNVIVLAWLVPVLILDIVGNTSSTGLTSDMYYYKSMADVLLGLFGAFFAFVAPAGKKITSAAKGDDEETVVSVGSLVKLEYVYCAILAFYALCSWWGLHEVNRSATGITSVASLVWSWVSLIVSLLAGLQFWNLKHTLIEAAAANFQKRLTEHN